MRALGLAAVAFLIALAASAAGTFTVTNVNDSGAGSLRQAILDANAAGGGTVAFNIASPPRTISLLSNLPTADASVVIDGTTQPGYAGAPLVEISGAQISSGGFVACLTINGSTVKGLAINRCSRAGILAYGQATIQKNYIGTDLTGQIGLANGAGIYMGCCSGSKTLIGGASDADGNLLSGNGAGVSSDFADDLVISHNKIGVDSTGTHGLANGAGLFLNDGHNISITHNVIAGNDYGTGVQTMLVTNMTIKNNLFGVSASGVPLPNGTSIYLFVTDLTTIGDLNGGGNTIANSKIGVLVLSDGVTGTGTRNVIRGNSFYNNQLAIDLAPSYQPDGVSANDPGDGDTGGNLMQNYPVLTKVTSLGGVTTVTGTFNSAANQTFTLDFYTGSACPSVSGDGRNYLGTSTVTTDSAGNATINDTFAATLLAGSGVSALATDAAGNTSEFSRCTSVEGAGVFAFSSLSAKVTEGSPAVTLNIVRLNGSVGPATVDFATAAGSATPGSDYTTTAATVAFANGETSKTISIPILDDAIYEGDETFTVALSNATGGASISSNAGTATVTIVDNEAPPVISVNDIRVTEGNSGTTPATFTLKLSSASIVPATVRWYTGNDFATAGEDYLSASGTVTFNPGETEKTIVVQVIGDTMYELDEDFYILLFSPSGATLSRDIAYCTIVNDDPEPILTADDVRVVEGNAGTKNAVITLKASHPAYGSVFYFTTTDTAVAGKDFTFVNNEVFFNHETEKQILIPIIGDTEVEPDETFTVTLRTTRSVGSLARSNITVTIVNDDVGIGPATQNVARGSSGSVIVDVGNPPATPQTIAIAASDPCIKAPASAVLTGRMATIAVLAVDAPCSARIDVTLPPNLGGKTLSAGIRTYEPLHVAFDPPSPKVYAGQSLNVHVTVSPLEGTVSLPLAAAGGTAEVPASVEVGPAGGTFAIKGVKAGPLVLFVTLPSQNGGGTAILNGEVVVAPATGAPAITGATPSSGSTLGGTTVSIAGHDFAADCWAFFDGVAAHSVVVADATQMIATTTPHAAGRVAVSVRCRAAQTSLADAFSYSTADDPSPVIIAVTPPAAAPGQLVTIEGSHFRISDRAAFDTAGATILLTTPDAHVVRVPSLPPGQASVNVTDANGHVSTTGPLFTVLDPLPPQITNVSPATVAAGGEIAIDGNGFRDAYTFALGDAAARIVALSYTHAVVRVPASLPPGTYELRLVDGSGQIAATGGSIAVTAGGVVVADVSPGCATSDGGSTIAISGSGFASGAGVTVDGVAATNVIVAGATRITATLPALAPGSATVIVTNPDGGSGTATDAVRLHWPFDPDGCGVAVRPRPARH